MILSFERYTNISFLERGCICYKRKKKKRQSRENKHHNKDFPRFSTHRKSCFPVENKRRETVISSSLLLDIEQNVFNVQVTSREESVSFSCVFCSGNREANDIPLFSLLSLDSREETVRVNSSLHVSFSIETQSWCFTFASSFPHVVDACAESTTRRTTTKQEEIKDMEVKEKMKLTVKSWDEDLSPLLQSWWSSRKRGRQAELHHQIFVCFLEFAKDREQPSRQELKISRRTREGSHEDTVISDNHRETHSVFIIIIEREMKGPPLRFRFFRWRKQQKQYSVWSLSRCAISFYLWVILW
jgi:hypothetical protein